MSRRTSEANKAVLEAWKREQEYVIEGKGTRDWSVEQQKSIVEIGKAYNDDGKAFEGHHMKSVERYPDYQGNGYNIQFLTKEEHLKAHCGNFQNSTNGYYNPVTGTISFFKEDLLEPCKVINLSNPVMTAGLSDVNDSEATRVELEENDDETLTVNRAEITDGANMDSGSKKRPISKALKSKVKTLGKVAWDNRELVATEAIKLAVRVAITKGARTSRGGQVSSSLDIVSSANTGHEILDRASPVEHIVRAYTRIQNGKEVHVPSYTRGGK